ncbi:MAG: hypothetical protein ACRDKJ_00350 [Actinomycetota bacterium]
MTKRLVLVGVLFLTLTLTGCASVLDPLPSQPCTAFGCNKPGNILYEVGGTIVFMGVLIAIMAGVVRRLSK